MTRRRQQTETSPRGRGQRPRRVGEELRHALTEILRTEKLRDPALAGASITVTEVAMSPDLRNATAYVMPLGGARSAEIIAGLRRSAAFLRGLAARRLGLRYAPALSFALDPSFDEAERVRALLARPEVARDLGPPDETAAKPDDERP
ncbi:MAG TPA: 30S ribosome-binding factor RbfA [Stellaceae bacterium]|nr:30S ribosome-binding factor RbfA [Stellaceae bacterium]